MKGIYLATIQRKPMTAERAAQRLNADVPKDIAAAAVAIAVKFDIGGVCDPMYIANIVAHRTKNGNGRSQFYVPTPTPVSLETADRIGKDLAESYRLSGVTATEVVSCLRKTMQVAEEEFI